MEFGSLLRRWREVRGYSQRHVAAEAGMSTRHLSFLETEYADAAEIYVNGRDGIMSEAAKANRSGLREQLGDVGEDLIRAFDEEVRESAYRDSPVTARGEDPTVRNHADFHTYLQDWLREARTVVDEFVVPHDG